MNNQNSSTRMLVFTFAMLLLTVCGIPSTSQAQPTVTPTRMLLTAKPSTVSLPSSMTPVQISQFPLGLFDCVECQGMTEEYFADGTLVVYLKGYRYVTGKWSVDGDVFYTGDSYCRDVDTMPASYKWHYDGEILTFQVIEDTCSDRVSSLALKPWRLIEEK